MKRKLSSSAPIKKSKIKEYEETGERIIRREFSLRTAALTKEEIWNKKEKTSVHRKWCPTTGRLIKEIHKENGMKNGICRKYYPAYEDEDEYNDPCERITMYINGKRHGFSYEITDLTTRNIPEDEIVITKIEEHYINGELNGERKIWSQYGISSTAHYSKGKLEGDWIFYDANENIDSLKHFLNGKAHGCNREWEDGNLIWEMHYRHGLRHGRYKENAGGDIYDGWYKNDMKHGKFVKWNADGSVAYRHLYENGKYIRDLEPTEKDLPFNLKSGGNGRVD